MYWYTDVCPRRDANGLDTRLCHISIPRPRTHELGNGRFTHAAFNFCFFIFCVNVAYTWLLVFACSSLSTRHHRHNGNRPTRSERPMRRSKPRGGPSLTWSTSLSCGWRLSSERTQHRLRRRRRENRGRPRRRWQSPCGSRCACTRALTALSRHLEDWDRRWNKKRGLL